MLSRKGLGRLLRAAGLNDRIEAPHPARRFVTPDGVWATTARARLRTLIAEREARAEGDVCPLDGDEVDRS